MIKAFHARAVLALLIGAAAVTAVLATTALAHKNSGSQTTDLLLNRVSNPGVPVFPITPEDEATLKQLAQPDPSGAPSALPSASEVFQLKTTADRSYYRIGNDAGSDCYAVGPAQVDTYRFGVATCVANGFPSAKQPIDDFSLFKRDLTTRSATLSRGEGIAADGVATIALSDLSGKIIAQTSVVDNTYHFDTAPDQVIGSITALSSDGQVLFTIVVTH